MRTLVYLCFLSIMQPLKYSKIEKCQENCYMGFVLQELGILLGGCLTEYQGCPAPEALFHLEPITIMN